MTMNPIVHFELPAHDRERIARFYSEVFGWKTQLLGAEMGNYVLATTTEMDASGCRPSEPGTINGGFFPRTGNALEDQPRVVIAVDDIQKAIKEVEHAGGKVHSEPMDIPGIGRFAMFTDTEGNGVGMLQPSGMPPGVSG